MAVYQRVKLQQQLVHSVFLWMQFVPSPWVPADEIFTLPSHPPTRSHQPTLARVCMMYNWSYSSGTHCVWQYQLPLHPPSSTADLRIDDYIYALWRSEEVVQWLFNTDDLTNLFFFRCYIRQLEYLQKVLQKKYGVPQGYFLDPFLFSLILKGLL